MSAWQDGVKRVFLFNSLSFPMLLGFSIIASVLIGFNSGIYPRILPPGLDNSFVYAFNYAAMRHMVWGRDFISTYGPYGYLIGAVNIGHLPAMHILFSGVLTLGCGIAAAVYVNAVGGPSLPARLACVLVLLYGIMVQDTEYRFFALFLVILLLGLQISKRKSLILFSIAGTLVGFYLLIKYSLGFGTLLTLIVGCVIARSRSLIARRLAIAITAVIFGFTIGWIGYRGAFPSPSELGAYINAAWQVSVGISSAQTLTYPPNGWEITPVCFFVWLVAIALWVVAERNTRILVSAIALGVPLFVAWKHSIVRQDEHVLILMAFGLFVTAILVVGSKFRNGYRVFVFAVVSFLLLMGAAFGTVAATRGGVATVRYLGTLILAPIEFTGMRELGRALHLRDYLEGAPASWELAALQPVILPDFMRRTIGSSSVDVYPWEIGYVPANELSWANRPMPFSFNAYTPALDKRNAAFFRSNRRPEYLIWHTAGNGIYSIDGRHLFWDEPRTLEAIIDNYDFINADANAMLLRVRAKPRFASRHGIGTVSVVWNSWIPVPQTSGVLSAAISVSHPLMKSVVRAIFREDAVFLHMRLASGEEIMYRLVPDNMKDGLWISPIPTTVEELNSLLRDGLARKVVAIRLSGGQFGGVPSNLRITWLQTTPGESPQPDAQRPIAHASEAANSRCAGSVDTVYWGQDWYGRSRFYAAGWARDGKVPIADGELWLFDSKNRILPTRVHLGLSRPDVAQYFGVPGLVQTGWLASSQASNGVADLGFIIRKRTGEWVRSCNKATIAAASNQVLQSLFTHDKAAERAWMMLSMVYLGREDLRRAFPEEGARDFAQRLLSWAITSGVTIDSAKNILLPHQPKFELMYAATVAPPALESLFAHDKAAEQAWMVLSMVYRGREDLRRAFPEGAKDFAQRLLSWATTSGVTIDSAKNILLPHKPKLELMYRLAASGKSGE